MAQKPVRVTNMQIQMDKKFLLLADEKQPQ